MLRHRLSFCLALLLAPACKHAPKQDHNRLAGDSSGSGCSAALSRSQDLALVERIAGIHLEYRDGTLSLDEQRAAIAGLIPAGAGDGSGVRMAAAAAQDAVAAALLIPAAIQFNPEEELPPALIYALRGVGVDSNLAYPYVAMMAERVSAPAAALRAAGAIYNDATGWSLTDTKLTAESVGNNPALRTAIAFFFSPEILAKIEDPSRPEAVFAGSNAVLPPAENGAISVIDRSEWERMTSAWLSTFKREAEAFISAVRKANTYGNLMKGRLVEMLGGERGSGGRTGPEIQVESSYKVLLRSIATLRGLGVGENLRRELVVTQKTLLNLEGESIKEGLAKLDLAQKAAIAAPFIPVAIWVAPYAGGLLGTQWAPVIAKAATTAAAMPLAFAAGSVALSTTLHLATGNRDHACDLYEQFITRASGALYSAAFAAWTPVLVATGSAAAAVTIPGAPAALTTYGLVNLGMAANSVAGMVASGIKGASECMTHIDRVRGSSQASTTTVNAAAGEALEACVNAGIDIGFAIVKTAAFTAEAYDALVKGQVSPQLHEQCDTGLGLVAKACGKKPKKSKSKKDEGDNLSPEELMAHYGKKAPYDQAEQEALAAYSDEAYRGINKALRSGDTPSGRSKIATYIREIDEAMAKARALPEDLVIYRGQPMKTKAAGTIDEGDIIEFDSYASTTINPLVADRFAFAVTEGGVKQGQTPVQYVINVPKGTEHKAVYMEQIPGIKYPGEQELLLPRGSKIKVTAVKMEERNIWGMMMQVKAVYAELVH